jgi:hypothetical protein
MDKRSATTASSTPTTTTTYTPFTLSSFPFVPLTTTFTPPAECAGLYLTRDYLTVIGGANTCFPPGFTTAEKSFFSPGLVCPSGYWSACHDTTGVSSISTVTCCPQRDDIVLQCVNVSTLHDVWTSLFCTWQAPETGTSLPVTYIYGGVTSTGIEEFASSNGVNAFGIRMVYETSDLPASSSLTSSLTRGPLSSTTTHSSAPSQSSKPSEQSSLESSGLSIGAKIGIGVAIPLAAIIGALISFLLWRRRNRANANAAPNPNTTTGSPDQTLAQFEIFHKEGFGKRQEADSTPRFEIGGMERVGELPAEDVSVTQNQ